LSCFWVDALPEDSVWQIGDEVAGGPRAKRCLARAELTRRDIAEAGLHFDDDPGSHSRHVDVCGWPTEKDEIKSVALELCGRAVLRIRA